MNIYLIDALYYIFSCIDIIKKRLGHPPVCGKDVFVGLCSSLALTPGS